jgi:hypothetical protein
MADRGVMPARAVEGLDPLEGRRGELGLHFPAPAVEELEPGQSEKALGRGVIERITDGPDRAEDSSCPEPPPERPRRVPTGISHHAWHNLWI